MNEEKRTHQETAFSPVAQLYATMAQEAAGLYKQMITISTAFLGGSLAFFDKFFTTGKASCSIWLLFSAWVALIYPVFILSWVRWQNVESHRHMLEYLKNESSDGNYKKAAEIAAKGRKWTKSAIISLALALALLAIFALVNVYHKI